ncbi:MAG: ribonuclease activity regulator RraA [Alphaproteobacteria bacterium]
MAKPIAEKTRELLREVSTATITTQLFKRGLRNVFMGGLKPLGAKARTMIGEAFTLRYIPSREDIDVLEILSRADHPQRRAIEETPPGHVLVMDARSEVRGATGGGILMTRLSVRGVAGVVTDSGLRDIAEIAELPMPVYIRAAVAPLNLVAHHAADLNVPIGCSGVPVYPGDIIVGDGDGVVCIPRHLAEEVAAEGWEMERKERFVTLKIKSGAPLFGTYPPDEKTAAEYQAWLDAGEPKKP